MTKTRAVSDEEVIAALLSCPTCKAAAGAVGLSERALYDRMNGGEFQARYKAAKADLIRAAVFRINNQLCEAIDSIAGIMRDDNASPAVRLQAAQTILNNAGKLSQNLQAAEAGALMQTEAARWDFFQ